MLRHEDFLISTYVRRELPRLLERQRSQRVRVVPIIARACPWNLHEWLYRLQVLPRGGEPIWRDDSRAVDEVLNEVVQAINGLLVREEAEMSPAETPATPHAEGDTAAACTDRRRPDALS